MILDRTFLVTWSIGRHLQFYSLRVELEIVGADLVGGNEPVMFFLDEFHVLAVQRQLEHAR